MTTTKDHLTYRDREALEMVIEGLKQQVANLRTRLKDAERAEVRLQAIDNYDRTVKGMIACDSRLQDAWDNFTVSYQMIAGDELLTRARDKVWKAEGATQDICPKCKIIKPREMGDMRGWHII